MIDPKGQRAWIIANGHSLLDTPLHLLQGEVTYAMNRIHLIYKYTTWRPEFFLMVDYNQQNPPGYWKDCIRAHWKTPKYLWHGFHGGSSMFPDLVPIGDVPETIWLDRCAKHHYYMGDNYQKRAESWHLPTICTAFSGIGALMQIAVLNGASELYIVGADLYGPDYRLNFFIPTYTSDLRPRDEIDNVNMTQVHLVARRSSPVPIYNATIGGKLDVYPRRDFYEVIDAPET